MKCLNKIIMAAALILISFTVQAQIKSTSQKRIDKKEVEIACGECMFKMPGKGCDLAVRIDGASYFVDGRGINEFGDAHADDGFCNAISKAIVTGEVIDGRFKAKSVQLTTVKKTEKPMH